MSERDLSNQPPTDGKPATEAPVVAGAGETFDALDSTTSLSAESGQDGSEQPEPAGSDPGAP